MSIGFILNGYTGYAFIGGIQVLLTSYSLTSSENIIGNDAVGNIINSSGKFTRTKLNSVRDYPTHEISMSFDVQKKILRKILKKATSKYYSFTPVSFKDEANGINLSWNDACLTSFSLSVSNNSQASMSVSFSCYSDSADISFGTHNKSTKHNAPVRFRGEVLMPYYKWGVSYPFFKDGDLYEFTISYSRSVTPKFGCEGKTNNNNAIAPKYVIFGVPDIKYELTYLVCHATTTSWHNINANEIANRNANFDLSTFKSNELVVKYNDGVKFKLTNCYPDSYSPSYGNSGDFNKITMSGTCYGALTDINIQLDEDDEYEEDDDEKDKN